MKKQTAKIIEFEDFVCDDSGVVMILTGYTEPEQLLGEGEQTY
jgi:hypothetical protein